MTKLLRRIRKMTESTGLSRGRPILIATRLPDSVEYRHAIGLDLENWLREDLIDILVGSFYMQLNPWEYLVEIAHKYDVAVFAGLSESRVRGDASPFNRNSIESYRGRAMRAWHAGVDGIYLFNYFNPRGIFLREIGDPDKLRKLDKIYYATIRNRNPNSYLNKGIRFQNIPILTPQNPMVIKVDEQRSINLVVGDDVKNINEKPVDVKLHLQIQGANNISVKLNGEQLSNPERNNAWTVFPVDPMIVKPGNNKVTITSSPKDTPESEDPEWNVIYTGTEKPASPWRCGKVNDKLLCELED